MAQVARKSKAYKQMSKQSLRERYEHRDIYESQQLERASIKGKRKPHARNIASVIVGLVVFAVLWAMWSFFYDFMWPTMLTNDLVTNFIKRDVSGVVVPTVTQAMLMFGWWKFGLTAGIGAMVGGLLREKLMKELKVENLDMSENNTYTNDQHLALPQEIMRQYDWVPDIGAHFSSTPKTIISHAMLSSKGLNKVAIAKRYTEDVVDESGEVLHYAGEMVTNADGDVVTQNTPMIDEALGSELFEASGVPSQLQRVIDARSIPYNPDGKDREKIGKFNTVADMINADWEMPLYEPARPAGAYLVDAGAVNTMMIAMTRAGKGQTYIEPMIDLWLRQKRPSNMVINDPKGELLVKHYVRATIRGYQVVQFNLINVLKTDNYNPIGMAADAAREGDYFKCSQYVENISDVMFANEDSSGDPVWNTSAANAFKRTVYGLIDYCYEEELEMRARALEEGTDAKVLDVALDNLWGMVTLYNAFQFFVQLSAKKMKIPTAVVDEKAKAGHYGDLDDEDNESGLNEYDMDMSKANAEAFLWGEQKEIDMLSLFFAATEALPRNGTRGLVNDANNSLKAAGGAEKMLASIYAISITAMSFFVDPTISTLTSCNPSQNIDLAGLSFPRRIGVRFAANYISANNLLGVQSKWEGFTDDTFTEKLGDDFTHTDLVNRQGWTWYYFDGKFPKNIGWIRMQLVNPSTGMLLKTFYFRFTKNYRTSFNGRSFVKDPVTNSKIVKDGILVEVLPRVVEQERPAITGAPATTSSGLLPGSEVSASDALAALMGSESSAEVAQESETSYVYEVGNTTYKQYRLTDITADQPVRVEYQAPVFMQNAVRYSEQPKAVFLVTPPHMMKYAKIILVLLKQLVDLNFDKSYMTKSSQKPLYSTNFMLDEVGNLQSEGSGITNLETMLSIGLGQEQFFTLILQTLQQLRDVYGDSSDKIIQGNAQPLSAKIATPTGWTTMGQIESGDVVLTPAGGTTQITGVFPRGVRKVYRVVRADGSSTLVCNEHLWEVEIEEPAA